MVPFWIDVLSAQEPLNRLGVSAVCPMLRDLYRFVYGTALFVSLYLHTAA